MNPKSIIILVPEAEQRLTKKGEYANDGNQIYRSGGSDTPRTVYQVHELTPPEGADRIEAGFWVHGFFRNEVCFSLPKPKKIKKWQWLYKDITTNRYSVSHFLTSEEASLALKGNIHINKIENSMREEPA